METINVVIETPKGSAQKYDYDKKTGFFKLKKILPAGMVFPYDFGFVPNTKGEDGDPLDVLVFSEFCSFPGCMIKCRIIGGIKAEQSKEAGSKTKIRNDRFFAIPTESSFLKKIKEISDLPKDIITEIQDFFITYNKIQNKIFTPIKILTSKEAIKLLSK